MSTVKFQGITITINGEERVAPPLTLGAMRKLLPLIKTLNIDKKGVPSDEDFGTMVAVVHASLVRNYPDITPQEIEDGLDMQEFLSCISAIMSVSGLQQGNVTAATETQKT